MVRPRWDPATDVNSAGWFTCRSADRPSRVSQRGYTGVTLRAKVSMRGTPSVHLFVRACLLASICYCVLVVVFQTLAAKTVYSRRPFLFILCRTTHNELEKNRLGRFLPLTSFIKYSAWMGVTMAWGLDCMKNGEAKVPIHCSSIASL